VRIIAGQWGGRRLLSPSAGTRPTKDRVRQILFDILGRPDPDAPVLDLYAGSGALGLEALSRGASASVFVEAARGARLVLERNCRELGAGQHCRILALRAERAVGILLREGLSFGWILADPPYDDPGTPALLERIGEDGAPLLRAGGCLALESRSSSTLPELAGALRLVRVRAVGETTLRFYRRGE